MLGIVGFYGSQELSLGQSIVLIGHANVPKNVFISLFRNEQATWKLCSIVIRPCRDDFKLFGVGMIVHFEVPSIEFPALEHNMFHQSTNLIVVWIER